MVTQHIDRGWLIMLTLQVFNQTPQFRNTEETKRISLPKVLFSGNYICFKLLKMFQDVSCLSLGPPECQVGQQPTDDQMLMT